MDLVDGDVQVLVVLVVVAGRDVLVLGEPQDVDKMLHDMLELFPVEASVLWVKRDDEVIRAVLACPGVLRLDGFDQPAGELDVVGGAYTGEVGRRGTRLLEDRCSGRGCSERADESRGPTWKGAGAGQSPEPSQSLDGSTHLPRGFAKLEAQPVVAGTVADAFSNGELQKATHPVQIGMKPRHLTKRLRVDGALQASSPEAPSEYLGARGTRLAGECFEAGEIVLIDAKRNHSAFLFCVGARFESGTVRGVTMDGQR